MKAESFIWDASQPLAGWTRGKWRGRQRHREKVWQRIKDIAKPQANSCISILFLYLIRLSCVDSQSFDSSFLQYHPSPFLPVFCARVFSSQQLLYVSLPPSVWLSLSLLQHLLLRISLSPVRWCWEYPSLYPPSPSSLLHIILTVILKQTQTLPFLHLLHSLVISPLCSLSASISTSALFSCQWLRTAHAKQSCCFLSMCLSESAC